jgi:hypothetical protein
MGKGTVRADRNAMATLDTKLLGTADGHRGCVLVYHLDDLCGALIHTDMILLAFFRVNNE